MIKFLFSKKNKFRQSVATNVNILLSLRKQNRMKIVLQEIFLFLVCVRNLFAGMDLIQCIPYMFPVGCVKILRKGADDEQREAD